MSIIKRRRRERRRRRNEKMWAFDSGFKKKRRKIWIWSLCTEIVLWPLVVGTTDIVLPGN